MTKPRRLALRGRLTTLLLLSLLPAFLLILIGAVLERDHSLVDSRAAAQRLANAAALMVERHAEVAQHALAVIAAAPPVRAFDAAGCSGFLASLYGSYPQFLNFGLVDTGGRLLCSTLPASGEIDLSDRDYVQSALRTGRFSVSRYYVGRVTGRGGVAFARRFEDADGSPLGVVFVTAHFDELDRIAGRLEPDADVVLSILDRDGVVVGSFPEWAWRGETLLDPVAIAGIATGDIQDAILDGPDGISRRHVFAPVISPAEGGLYVSVGVDETAAALVARHIFYLGLAAVLVVATMSVLILHVGVGWMLESRIRRITRAADRFVAGDLSARVGEVGSRDELGAIARAFDSLADAVETRDRMREAAHDELEASQQLNAAILDSLDAVIAVLDAKGIIIAVNARWREFARRNGGSDDVIEGVGIDYLAACEVPPDEDGAGAREGIRAVFEGRMQVFSVEYPCHSPNSEHWFIMRATPLRGAPGAVIAHVEITARKRAEQRMAVLMQELSRSNRDLQDFAYVASHDLQEPLRKITTFSERLRGACADRLTARDLDYLERMASAASRMQRLINDLLEFSRVATQARPMARVALDRVVADVLSDLEERIRASRAVIDVGPLPAIEADETQMRQVFQNLVANALKFVRAGEAPVVRIDARSVAPGEVRICVCDEGIGIPHGAAGRIFAPFVRMHGRSDYEGSGMGLAVVRRIVDRHGGRVCVESTEGQGACFCVELPMRHPAETGDANGVDR